MTRQRAPVVAVIVPAHHQDEKPLPMLPWFPASFTSSTRGWPLTARGIYRELLDLQWELGGLPADPAELRALVGATPQEWKHWRRVEPKFPLTSDGMRRNTRLEHHRAESRRRSRAAADNANKRWEQERMRKGEQHGGSNATA